MLNPQSLFVTGTDTGIGKTHVSCAMLTQWRNAGAKVAAMKPVASGCEMVNGAWRNADALALQDAADDHSFAYSTINPYALPDPIAPQFAAANVGQTIHLEPIARAYGEIASHAQCVIVEGVGGWLAPISADMTQADIARALGLPILLVVGLRLGCLNHARLSVRAIRADGLKLLGWVANTLEPNMLALEQNIRYLEEELASSCLQVMPFKSNAI
jgi:dethiobiotin synthetase